MRERQVSKRSAKAMLKASAFASCYAERAQRALQRFALCAAARCALAAVLAMPHGGAATVCAAAWCGVAAQRQ